MCRQAKCVLATAVTFQQALANMPSGPNRNSYNRNSYKVQCKKGGAMPSFGNCDSCAVAYALRSARPGCAAPPCAVQEPETKTICVLAVPADMGIAEFCAFLGSYMPLIATMRMVRREGCAKCTCMAAIDFQDVGSAREFVRDYNGRPFSSLEPEIICRAVFTTAVEIHHPAGKDDAAAASSVSAAVTGNATQLKAPDGHIELPTCPVCLERLDEHVSGIFTTVRYCLRSNEEAAHITQGTGCSLAWSQKQIAAHTR